jgi:hypothetical protein
MFYNQHRMDFLGRIIIFRMYAWPSLSSRNFFYDQGQG